VRSAIALSLSFVAAFAAPAHAKITAITVERVEDFADGASFGEVGAYERVSGKAKGELDPTSPLNRGIVDLAKAPLNARGLVEYETEFFLLRPKDPAKGSHTLVYEVNNRGNKYLIHQFDRVSLAKGINNDPKTLEDAGDGLLFQRGYTLAWSGWDPDVPRNNHQISITVPVASDNGHAIVREIRDEFVPGNRGVGEDALQLSHEAVEADAAKASLTVRRKEAYPPETIPAGRWTFVDARHIRLLPDGTKFEKGAIYDFHYRAQNPKVTGIGFAATRDFVAALRDPLQSDVVLAPGITHTITVGISQSGRFLRDFLWQGFNREESGGKVFDAVFSYIAGAGKVFLNAEFAEPFRTSTQHEDHFMPENAFPFSEAHLHDPVTGRSDAILRGDGSDPLVFEVNSSTEYWQKGASLLTTDPSGERDVTLPETVRAYLVAGTHHYGPVPAEPGLCVNRRNPHDPAPALRALLVDLEEWLAGRAPPVSRVPRIGDGTLVRADATGFPALPGLRITAETHWLGLYGDWVHPKPERDKAYRPLVPKVNESGNETSGILLPDIAAPVATYTGWNLYAADFAEGELCDRFGSYLPFARTKADRSTNGDPRPSLEERYGDQASYVTKITAAANALVKERLLLPEDAQRYIDAARAAKLF
jgi:alpha/beta hydrolase family protein